MIHYARRHGKPKMFADFLPCPANAFPTVDSVFYEWARGDCEWRLLVCEAHWRSDLCTFNEVAQLITREDVTHRLYENRDANNFHVSDADGQIIHSSNNLRNAWLALFEIAVGGCPVRTSAERRRIAQSLVLARSPHVIQTASDYWYELLIEVGPYTILKPHFYESSLTPALLIHDKDGFSAAELFQEKELFRVVGEACSGMETFENFADAIAGLISGLPDLTSWVPSGHERMELHRLTEEVEIMAMNCRNIADFMHRIRKERQE